METGHATGHREPWVELDHGFGWNDLVLGRREREQLRAIAAKVRLHGEATRAGAVRPGLTALFVGASGTGKTMAAQILGSELGRPVLQVDLVSALSAADANASAIVDRVFDAASPEQAIIVFDGVRSFVGRRARAPIETAELLERASKHDGLVIFTWRPSGSIDLWLPDQVDFLVELPFPAARARSEIWRRELPADARLSDGDIRHLARSFRLAGGVIRRCAQTAIAAAAAAGVPVGLEHIASALEQEYSGAPLAEHTRLALTQLRANAAPAVLEDEQAKPAESRRPWRRAPREPQTEAPESSPAPMPAREEPDVAQPVSAAQAGAPAGRIGRGWMVIGVVVTVLAAVAGFAIARRNDGSARPAALDRSASTSAVRLSYPSDWRRQATAAQGLPSLGGAVALGPDLPRRGLLVIGRAHGTDATLLPADLRSELPSLPSAQVVTLGSLRFLRYSGLVPRGGAGAETAYAAPTTAGTVVAVCAPRGAGPGFGGQCEKVLSTVRLVSGRPLTPGPDATYGAALDGVIARLEAARSRESARLRAAKSPGAVEQAATALAAAHTAAASAVLRMNAGQAAAANSALGKALQTTAAAYSALDRAAATRNQSGYRTAGAELTRANAAVTAAYAQLSRLGYNVG
jgi:ATPase family associated with various cellular activities (AAA)